MFKVTLSLFVVAGFISIAVFGFTAIGTPGCIAQLSSGGMCLANSSAWDQAAFYLSAFQSFSAGIIQLAAALLALIALLLIGSLVFKEQFLSTRLAQYEDAITITLLPLKKKLLHFLALHQFSQPVLVRL